MEGRDVKGKTQSEWVEEFLKWLTTALREDTSASISVRRLVRQVGLDSRYAEYEPSDTVVIKIIVRKAR